jgi:hypothetical protein
VTHLNYFCTTTFMAIRSYRGDTAAREYGCCAAVLRPYVAS